MSAFDDPNARDRVIRAIIGEAGGEGPEGWAAVAHVIKNRADSGRWGEARSVSQVLSPSQFSALNPKSPAYARVSGADPSSPEYQRIGALVDAVFGGQLADPTGGADHYYAPGGMGARQSPEWARKGTNLRQIGKQVFMTIGGGSPASPAANPHTVGDAAGGRGLENSAGTMGVDPRLVNILQAAATNFPGYTVKVTSGERKGDPRFHGKGMATDVVLIDPNGKAVPNYQNAGAFGIYEKFAQTARTTQQQLYPDLDKSFRWGGYFSGPKGKYGAADLMHFDLGGHDGLGMAGGTWEDGLNANQRALFPGVQSVGMRGGGPNVSLAGFQPSGASPAGGTGGAGTGVAPQAAAAPAPVVRSSAQGSSSGWILPDAQGRLLDRSAPPGTRSNASPTAGVQSGGTVSSTPLPVARPTLAGDRPTEPGGTPLPAYRPTEPAGTPLAPFRPTAPGGTFLDLFTKPTVPGGTPLEPYRPTAPGGTPLEAERPSAPGGTPLEPYRPTAPGGTPLPPFRPTAPGGTPLQPQPKPTLTAAQPMRAGMFPTPPARPPSLPTQAPQQSWWQSLFGL